MVSHFVLNLIKMAFVIHDDEWQMALSLMLQFFSV